MIVGGGGGAGGSSRSRRSRPKTRNIASAAFAGAQAAAPAPRSYVTPTSSGQYSAPRSSSYSSPSRGGGAPRNPSPPRQGPIQSVGREPAPKPKPKPKPKPPSIQKFLAGDDVYQDQISQLMKQLENFITSNKSQRGDVREDFRTSLGKMNKQKGLDLENLENDFAARGLLNSGLYTDAVGDYNQQFQTQMDDLTTSRQRSLSDLLESLQNYRTENQGQRKNARSDAIRRRAEKFGIRR